ncbi:MAG: putative bifunctional diguanylate cyclase/phosphodiesterase [Solirubrobacteraceae bacterium]
MSTPHQPPNPPAQATVQPPAHPHTVTVFQAAALLGAGVVCVLTANTAQWRFSYLVALIILAVVSEITATSLPSGSMSVSGSFQAIALAIVLLGGPPAAIVGVASIGAGWLQSREPGIGLRQNLVTYAWFPLLSGLVFHIAASHAGVGLENHAYWQNPAYYLLVFMTFMLALALNFVMTAAYLALRTRTSLITKLAEIAPVVAAELSSAILTVLAALLTNDMGIAGLLLFAIVLVVFQYLIGELLTSQRRGEELRMKAITDELTGLPNRNGFSDILDHQIEQVSARGGTFGVLLIDLDHFRDINDTLGHQYGDQLLKDLGPRLAARVAPTGVVARFGGDEFAVLPAVHTDNLASLTAIAEDLMACIHEPVVLGEISPLVEASIGIARYPTDGTDAQTLMRRADVAVYQAKGERNSHRFYTLGQDHHSAARLSMVGDFRRALDANDQIVVHYHPIININSGRVHGAEALVRWQHPQVGLLQPAAFLDIVEQTGLIGEMTDRILDKAIAECAAWRAAGRNLKISANLSIRNLHDPMLSSDVAQMLERHRLPPEALTLEITESMILSDRPRALETVASLSDIGVRFAVDDFGTGHSSLANLRALPVHELKVDRSFVTPMLNKAADGVIVRNTVELGHALGLVVVAEGVETVSTLRRLEQIHCDLAQGHFFSKPLPPIDFMSWVDRYEQAIRTVS